MSARRYVLVSAFAVLFGLTNVAAVDAQSCGSTIAGTVPLTANLACPTGHGLVLTDGATLDCAGHSITGGDQPGQYGVYVLNASASTVKNCTVAHFQIGIRLVGATNATIAQNVTQYN